MASLIYNSALQHLVTGTIDANTDTFWMMLVNSGYTPNKDHEFRSDVTGEVTGTGYTSGGQAVTLTVTKDNTNDRTDIATSAVNWATATISAATGAVIYKRRGGASSADELLCFIEFTAPTSSTGATFSVGAVNPAIRFAQA